MASSRWSWDAGSRLDDRMAFNCCSRPSQNGAPRAAAIAVNSRLRNFPADASGQGTPGEHN
jgi:hypothetical protein